ncbi:MAG: hypothetical protein FWG50_02910 [Kiritimatiellaeota bacterium]|nr:hypothetical protein [Kiritimatiellota bacterium]
MNYDQLCDIPIPIDRENLTIIGVPFSDLATLVSTANAVRSSQVFGGVAKIFRRFIEGNALREESRCLNQMI